MTMQQYARVTILPECGGGTVTIEVISDEPQWLYGWECTAKTGDRGDRQRLIDKAAIKRLVPLRMNLHYGELERIGS